MFDSEKNFSNQVSVVFDKRWKVLHCTEYEGPAPKRSNRLTCPDEKEIRDFVKSYVEAQNRMQNRRGGGTDRGYLNSLFILIYVFEQRKLSYFSQTSANKSNK